MNSINRAFREFHEVLRTPERESEAARDHRASIKTCLEQHFGMTEFFQSGSFGHGTNVPVHSDVDRFAVLPAEELDVNSKKILWKIRVALVKRFPTTKPIRVSAPGVILAFGPDTLELTEIIPAMDIGEKNGCQVFQIPSPSNNGWIASAPKSHRKYVTDIDQEWNGAVKPLIRFLKLWKYEANIPIQSIYLELYIAGFADRHGLLTPSIDIARILNSLKTEKFPNLLDPLGISGWISACSQNRDRANLLLKINGESKLATNAVVAEIECREIVAQRLWFRFFRRKFPKP